MTSWLIHLFGLPDPAGLSLLLWSLLLIAATLQIRGWMARRERRRWVERFWRGERER